MRGDAPEDVLDQVAEELIESLGERPPHLSLSYSRGSFKAMLGVVSLCSERDAGRLIGQLRRVSLAHPMIRVSLGGYGTELPPTVLEEGRFQLFGDAYRSFCAPCN